MWRRRTKNSCAGVEPGDSASLALRRSGDRHTLNSVRQGRCKGYRMTLSGAPCPARRWVRRCTSRRPTMARFGFGSDQMSSMLAAGITRFASVWRLYHLLRAKWRKRGEVVQRLHSSRRSRGRRRSFHVDQDRHASRAISPHAQGHVEAFARRSLAQMRAHIPGHTHVWSCSSTGT